MCCQGLKSKSPSLWCVFPLELHVCVPGNRETG